MQIKDDVCAQGVGREHDKRLLAVLHRFKEYGITLRREKCRLGQPEVMFGNVFHKGSMSPDPDKVDTIKGWPAPEDKTALKSFLQTIQFCSPFMRAGEGQAYSDISAPLRQLTAQEKHFKWTVLYDHLVTLQIFIKYLTSVQGQLGGKPSVSFFNPHLG